MRTVHRGIHGRAGELGSFQQLFPCMQLAFGRDIVGSGETVAPLVIRLDHRHTTYLVRMAPRVRSVRVKTATTGAHDDNLDCAHLPITLTKNAIIPMNANPINSVNTVMLNSAEPGRNVTNKPSATTTITIAQRNAARPSSGLSTLASRHHMARDHVAVDVLQLGPNDVAQTVLEQWTPRMKAASRRNLREAADL